MRILCENCGEMGTDKERWMYSMIPRKAMNHKYISKIEDQKCLDCGGRLFVDEKPYETMSDGSPYRNPSPLERLGLKRFVNKKAKVAVKEYESSKC